MRIFKKSQCGFSKNLNAHLKKISMHIFQKFQWAFSKHRPFPNAFLKNDTKEEKSGTMNDNNIISLVKSNWTVKYNGDTHFASASVIISDVLVETLFLLNHIPAFHLHDHLACPLRTLRLWPVVPPICVQHSFMTVTRRNEYTCSITGKTNSFKFKIVCDQSRPSEWIE